MSDVSSLLSQILTPRRSHVIDLRRSQPRTDLGLNRDDAERLVGAFFQAAARGTIAAPPRPVMLDDAARRRLVELVTAVARCDANGTAAAVRQWMSPTVGLIRTIDRSTVADRVDWSIAGVAWTLQGIQMQITRNGVDAPELAGFVDGLLYRLDALHDVHPSLLDGFSPSDVCEWLAS